MLISIVTVSYNSANTISYCIESVNRQQYGLVEHIFIDGGSTDNTLNIIARTSSRNTLIVSEPDNGIYDAMNKGIALASGDIIGILNSDDFYLDHMVLDEVKKLFESSTELEAIIGGVDFVNGSDLNHPIRQYPAGSFKPWMFRFGLMPPHPGVFLKKSTYERVGFYKLGYEIAADFDFLTRLLLIDGAKYRTTHKTWVRMRTGGVSTDGLKSNIVSTREMKRSLRENGLFASSLMLMSRLLFKFLAHVLCK